MDKKKKYRSDFLFPNSTFLIGMGSVFNIAGNYFEYNYSNSEEEADINALKSDWGIIGQDMFAVMNCTSKIVVEDEQRTPVQ
jgi:hypothetical protein